ncbi:hypothetical protein SAMN05444920_14019 [Nonomuraea solani]|uniref:Uncharacterized protein n=1 Tax=Nonomuraea solani TaxID=1144553 RepID=A0A1H6F3H7_9ACTN|nr:hypothetical protein [Nonomuraea solani]SEH03605.1 hypothetical protein SAMN05444920_14019 [Nonomuraea solani]
MVAQRVRKRWLPGYGDPPGSGESLRDAAGIDNGPAPTWSAVADDHDAVRLTFAGLSVLHTTEEFSTTLWAWNWESTYWPRSVFIADEGL